MSGGPSPALVRAGKNALIRLIEQSVTDKVVQITTVLVEEVPGAPMSGRERYGILATLGAALVATALAFD